MKAQVAMEFIIMVGLMMIFVLGLAATLYFMSISYAEERDLARLRDLGYSLQDEIILASQVETGYHRAFTIPERVGDAQYLISQTANDLVISYKGVDLLFPIPEVTGSFAFGNNTIAKTADGVIQIN